MRLDGHRELPLPFQVNGITQLYKLQRQQQALHTQQWLVTAYEANPHEWYTCKRTDTVEDGIYGFKLQDPNHEVLLTRIYPTCQVKWAPNEPATGGDDFSELVGLRQNHRCAVCKISRITTQACTASHLTPRRLGIVSTT